MGKAQGLLACVSTTAGELKCYYSPVQEHGGECIWPHTPCKRVYIRHQPKLCVWRATASLSTSGYTGIVRHYNTQIAPCRRRIRCFIAVSVSDTAKSWLTAQTRYAFEDIHRRPQTPKALQLNKNGCHIHICTVGASVSHHASTHALSPTRPSLLPSARSAAHRLPCFLRSRNEFAEAIWSGW